MPSALFLIVFNFSANHLFLLLLQDRDTKRVCRLYAFTKARVILPNVAYCVAGKVNSADKLYLVIESVRPDGKHRGSPTTPTPADGAERAAIDELHCADRLRSTQTPMAPHPESAPTCAPSSKPAALRSSKPGKLRSF
jgi:hypothetical protein